MQVVEKADEDKNILLGLEGLFNNIILKTGVKKLAEWLWEKKSRLAWTIIVLVFSIVATVFWFNDVQPKIDNIMLMTRKVNSIEKQQDKSDSLLILIHKDMKSGFKVTQERFDSIDNRFINIDYDFNTLIHYVAKNVDDEKYLRREIIEDHQKLK